MKEKLKNNYFKKYRNLEKALNDGAKIHIFRSGGGLRVVSVERGSSLLSYGEYPYLAGALAHAERDFGLSYEDQYMSSNARHDHYLSGAYPMPGDPFDNYVFCSYGLDIFYSEAWKKFICTTRAPLQLNRKNDILWGSADNFIGAITSCLLSFHIEDEDSFMKRVYLWISRVRPLWMHHFFILSWRKSEFYYT